MRLDDESVNALYIELRDTPYAYGKVLDDDRNIDDGADDQPIGIELLNVHLGVNLDNIPERDAAPQLLEDHHIKLFA